MRVWSPGAGALVGRPRCCTLETDSPVGVLNASSQQGFRCTPPNTPAGLPLCGLRAVVFLLTDHRSKNNVTAGSRPLWHKLAQRIWGTFLCSLLYYGFITKSINKVTLPQWGLDFDLFLIFYFFFFGHCKLQQHNRILPSLFLFAWFHMLC